MEEKMEILSKLKEEIEKAKTNLAILKSKKEDALLSLKEKFGVKTTKEAEKLLSEKENELSKLKITIDKKFKKLEEDYQW
jgi:ribosome-binding ATPase YchF (GTP1/OBG family)